MRASVRSAVNVRVTVARNWTRRGHGVLQLADAGGTAGVGVADGVAVGLEVGGWAFVEQAQQLGDALAVVRGGQGVGGGLAGADQFGFDEGAHHVGDVTFRLVMAQFDDGARGAHELAGQAAGEHVGQGVELLGQVQDVAAEQLARVPGVQVVDPDHLVERAVEDAAQPDAGQLEVVLRLGGDGHQVVAAPDVEDRLDLVEQPPRGLARADAVELVDADDHPAG